MTAALVTGGTGFIGAHLVRRLVKHGMAVHLVCRPTANRRRLQNIASRIAWHTASLADARALRRIAERVQPDYVFHLAAATMHGGRPAAAPARVIATTVLGTVKLTAACERVPYRCFVHTGDAFEYAPRERPLRESGACRPTTVDGIAKLAASLYALAVARQRRRPIVVVRPFSIFGPLDDPRRLIPRLFAAARDGSHVALSKPDIARDFLYVDDLVDLYLDVIAQPDRAAGEIFNAGSGRETTLAALVRTIERVAGARLHPLWGTYSTAAHDAERRRADIAKARRLLGWRPRTPLARGLTAAYRHASQP